MTEQFTVEEIIDNSHLILSYSDLSTNVNGLWLKLFNKSGCYIFLNGDCVQYVGSSGNLYQRIVSHNNKNGLCNMFSWTDICFIYCNNYKKIEKYLINKFDPNFNNSKAGFSVTAESGTKEGETRYTVIIKIDTLEKLKAIAYMSGTAEGRKTIKDVVAEMSEQYIDKYEKKHGVIKI